MKPHSRYQVAARSVLALGLLAIVPMLSACGTLPGLAAPSATPTATATPTLTATPTATVTPTVTPSPTPAPLALTARLEPEVVPQGQMATLLIETSRPASPSATLDGQPLTLFEEGGRWYGLIAVWAGTPTGSWPLEITADDPLGGPPAGERLEVRISARAFQIDRVTLSAETLGLLAPEYTKPENELLAQLLAPRTPERLWQGPFRRPVAGEVTTDYGQRRSYNGGPASDYHGGLDLAIDEGQPVAATNAGRVVFAGPLKVRGNVVIIDHGWGLYSGYFHMSAISVETGQEVQRGQTVGLVGSTGLSTGPHLHWQIWLDGYAIDPVFLEQWQLPE